MAVVQVTTATFRREVLESEVPVVVDFYADWCEPCRMVSPAIAALSDEWDGRIRFVKVDIDKSPELAEAYGVMSIPTIMLFERGEVAGWVVGARPGYLIERELGLRERVGSPAPAHEEPPSGSRGRVA
jgi:thioredoxin 1